MAKAQEPVVTTWIAAPHDHSTPVEVTVEDNSGE
jgi:hypothetical protein